jgi:hypothetical protein
MNEWLNNMKVCALKERSCRKYECDGLKVIYVKFLTTLYMQDYSVPARCHFPLFQRQRFGNWICCRLRVKVRGGIYWVGSDRKMQYLISFTNFNAQFFYSITICMLRFNPRHVSSINMLVFRRTNCIITASGVVALCKRLHSLLSSGILWSRLQRATTPDAVIIQFVLLKMGMLMLETCRGL